MTRLDRLIRAQWRHGKFGGVGMERFADGALYVGEYEAGVAQGLGICLFLNGDTYEVNPTPKILNPKSLHEDTHKVGLLHLACTEYREFRAWTLRMNESFTTTGLDLVQACMSGAQLHAHAGCCFCRCPLWWWCCCCLYPV